MSQSVEYQQQDRIVHLLLNRPDTRNALSADVIDGLVSGLKRANNDEGVSCVVISGAGKGFSSGGNLNEIKAMTTTQKMSEPELKAWYTDGIQQIPLTLHNIDVITICLLYTSPSPRDGLLSRMPSSA